jgi:hypothetical protein
MEARSSPRVEFENLEGWAEFFVERFFGDAFERDSRAEAPLIHTLFVNGFSAAKA